MRFDDIKVGEEYAVGNKYWPIPGKVIRKGVIPWTINVDDSAWVGHKGVLVRDDGFNEVWYPSRKVYKLWAVWADSIELMAEVAQKNAEVMALRADTNNQLEALFLQITGVNIRIGYSSYLTADDARTILALIKEVPND